MRGTIVCGVAETDEGRGAAELAAALGERLGLRLVLVSVLDGVPAGTDESVTARQRQNGAERMLSDLARAAGNGAEARIALGEQAEAIAQVAAEEGADLIVLGSRAAGFGSRKLRCTLATALEAVTPVPVLVAPPATRRRSGQRLAPPVEAAVGAAAR